MAGGERWWLLLPPPRFEPQPLPPELWLGLAGALAVLVAIAVFFVRGIVGPLARLGEAVSATSDTSAGKVLPEGPKEVRRLAERHNAMLSRLAAADAERREMLAGLTHDLRAPLARDTDDMERIVSQCLAFLHSDENSERAATPLLIADAISNEVARHRELGRPVEMTASDAVAACRVAIVHVNLQRPLDNLIDNALQYGAPPVVVSLSAVGAGRVRLCVRDHGPGIAPEQRERVLDAFSQTEPARATGGSCGLGLAIVRRIATGCGGELMLAGAAGGGLEVLVDFPVCPGDETNPVL